MKRASGKSTEEKWIKKSFVGKERKQHRLMLNTKIHRASRNKIHFEPFISAGSEWVSESEREWMGKGIKLHFYQTLSFSLFISHHHVPLSQNLSRTIYLTFLLSSGAQARSNYTLCFCNNIHLFFPSRHVSIVCE